MVYSGSDEIANVEALKQSSFLVVKSDRLPRIDQPSGEDEFELAELTNHFVSRTGLWTEYFSDNTDEQPSTASDAAIHEFIQSLMTPLDSVLLDTTWTPKNAFKLVCFFTDDASGDAYPHRVAVERGMQYASVDAVVDECVQLSLDAQKQVDASALSEREVGRASHPLSWFAWSFSATSSSDEECVHARLCLSGGSGSWERSVPK